ncbi:P-II family nitrogen regulator [Desulfovibrio intestinalis]|uniref:Nitrogen regulatory protein PII 1 n=1 Tax=Desulfovibrio intestinalis TaxID=58621 RepID=A0A7W8BZW5_9BACT|nr:nitrogen regulatory protein PII 1 [Desulfovibrio intestinalis]
MQPSARNGAAQTDRAKPHKGRISPTAGAAVLLQATQDKGEHQMQMIRTIIRPEKTTEVLSELMSAGFPAVTKLDVVGRGKQKGIMVGDVQYDEIPKQMLMLVVNDEDKDDAVRVILRVARTGENGHYGDGRVFVSSVSEAWTISTGKAGL